MVVPSPVIVTLALAPLTVVEAIVCAPLAANLPVGLRDAAGAGIGRRLGRDALAGRDRAGGRTQRRLPGSRLGGRARTPALDARGVRLVVAAIERRRAASLAWALGVSRRVHTRSCRGRGWRVAAGVDAPDAQVTAALERGGWARRTLWHPRVAAPVRQRDAGAR